MESKYGLSTANFDESISSLYPCLWTFILSLSVVNLVFNAFNWYPFMRDYIPTQTQHFWHFIVAFCWGCYHFQCKTSCKRIWTSSVCWFTIQARLQDSECMCNLIASHWGLQHYTSLPSLLRSTYVHT